MILGTPDHKNTCLFPLKKSQANKSTPTTKYAVFEPTIQSECTSQQKVDTCEACNKFKGSILPDDFMDRITEIFMFQLEKKYSGKWFWRFTKKFLKSLV